MPVIETFQQGGITTLRGIAEALKSVRDPGAAWW
jgi:hypothetical protein